MTRVLRIVPFVCLVLLLAHQLAAQSATSAAAAPVRDAQAVAAIQHSIVALGGAVNLQVYNAVVQGTIHDVSSHPNLTATFVWKDDWSGSRPEFRRETHQGDLTDIFASGGGKPGNSHNGQTTAVPFYAAYSCAAFHLPGIVLAVELADTRYSFSFMGDASVDGAPAVEVQTSLTTHPVTEALTTQNWYFDAKSGLPLRVEYRVTSTLHIMKYKTVSIDFSNFSSVSGVLLPLQMREHGLAGETDIVTVTSVVLNSGVSPADFVLLGGRTQ